MRISDWSSDVCSSDLPCRRIGGGRDPLPGVGRAAGLAAVAILSLAWAGPAAADERLIRDYLVDEVRQWSSSPVVMMTLEASNARYLGLDQAGIQALDQQWVAEREVEGSEEHTSELQSLMRTSYDVFVLKKKKTKH